MIVRRARVFLVSAVVGVLTAGARPAAAQSLITNGGFDGSATGWDLTQGIPPSTYDSTVDIANNASSGSARIITTLLTGDGTPIAVQCINVSSHIHEQFTFTANVLFSAVSPAGSGQGAIAWQGFSDTACVSPETIPVESLFAPQTTGVWQTNSMNGVVPATVGSIQVAVGVFATTTGGAFVVNADNLDFVTTAAVPAMNTTWLTTLGLAMAGVGALAVRLRARAT